MSCRTGLVCNVVGYSRYSVAAIVLRRAEAGKAGVTGTEIGDGRVGRGNRSCNEAARSTKALLMTFLVGNISLPTKVLIALGSLPVLPVPCEWLYP